MLLKQETNLYNPEKNKIKPPGVTQSTRGITRREQFILLRAWDMEGCS